MPTSTLSPLAATRVRDVLVFEEPHVTVALRAARGGGGDHQVAVLALPYVSRTYERTDRYKHALDTALAEAARWARTCPLRRLSSFF